MRRGVWIAVWLVSALAAGPVAAQCVSLQDRGTDLRLTTTATLTSRPDVVWNGSGYAMVYLDESDVFFQRLDSDGQAVGARIRVNDPNAVFDDRARLVWNGSGYGVAWTRAGTPAQVLFARLDASGTRLGAEVVVDDGDGLLQLAWNGNGYGLVYSHVPGSNAPHLFAALTAGGVVTSMRQIVEATFLGSNFGLVWDGSHYGYLFAGDVDGIGGDPLRVYFLLLDTQGNALSSRDALSDSSNGPAFGSELFADLVWTGTEFGAVWAGVAPGLEPDEIYFARIDASGSQTGSTVQVTPAFFGTSRDPSISWSGTRYGVSWEDFAPSNYEIYFAELDTDGDVLGGFRRLTQDVDDSGNPSLVWNGAGYGVVWQDDRDGNYELYFTGLDCCTDGDLDGVSTCAGDCDDGDGSVYPGAPQLCDGVHNDCDDASWPAVPAGEADQDADGFRGCAGDCDDGDGSVYPGAPQLCDGVHNDCDDASWPAVPAGEADQDADGFRACAGDCDDATAAVFPGAPGACDGLNNDCNDAQWPGLGGTEEADDDADGFSECAGDCDDAASQVFPGQLESCDGLDNDCDVAIDEGTCFDAVPFEPGQQIATDADAVRALAVGDLDGDARLDVLSASAFDDKLAWYRNAGDGEFDAGQTISTSQDFPTALAVGDLDRDGDEDVVAASQNDDSIVWYANDGSGLFTARPALTTTLNLAATVALSDLDGDGDLDVVAGGLSEVLWYANDGAGAFTTQAPITTSVSGAVSVACGDLDGDGDDDVVTVSLNADTVTWHRNDGSGGFTAAPAITTTADGAYRVHIADFDGDGDPDVLVGSQHDDTVAWYANDGGGAFGAARVIATDADTVRAVVAADLDLDGDLDVLRGSLTDDTIAWHENEDGAGAFGAAHSVSTEIDGVFDVLAADLDGDGDVDVVAGGFSDDTVAWFENRLIHRNATFLASDLIADLATEVAELVAVDLDRDGDLDAVAALFGEDEIAWYENLGGAGGWTTHSAGALFEAAALAVADLDGDGDADLAASGGTETRWFENRVDQGAGFASHAVAARAGELALHDLDRDGDPDLVLADAAANEIVWFRNDAAAFTAQPGIPVPGEVGEIDVGDLDGDGDPDLAFALRGADLVRWAENTAGNGSAWIVRDIAGHDGPSDVTIADVDRDGDLDVLTCSGNQGDVEWYENLGGAPPAWQARLAGTPTNCQAVFAGDADADGDVDLLVSARNLNLLFVYENDGQTPPQFSETALAEAAGGPQSASWADLDRDGDPDILLGTNFTGTVRWRENGGGQFGLDTEPPAAGPLPVGGETPALAITMTHNGRAGDTDEELVRLELSFESVPGTPLADAQLAAQIERLRLYVDDGSGTLEPQTDARLADLGDWALDQGRLTLVLDDASAEARVVHGTPRTYFVSLVTPCHGAPPDGFLLTHVTESGSGAEDRAQDIPLTQEVASSFTADVTFDGQDLDADGDLFGACSGDCDDADAATYPDAPETNDGLDNQCPGDAGHGLVDEASGLLFHAASDLAWTPQPGATGYEVARASAPDFVADCAVFVAAAAMLTDATVPPHGGVLYYLARANAPFPGSWGRDSGGVERSVACAP